MFLPDRKGLRPATASTQTLGKSIGGRGSKAGQRGSLRGRGKSRDARQPRRPLSAGNAGYRFELGLATASRRGKETGARAAPVSLRRTRALNRAVRPLWLHQPEKGWRTWIRDNYTIIHDAWHRRPGSSRQLWRALQPETNKVLPPREVYASSHLGYAKAWRDNQHGRNLRHTFVIQSGLVDGVDFDSTQASAPHGEIIQLPCERGKE